MHERTCLECGAAFMPRCSTQVCCSDECKLLRKRRLTHESCSARNAKRRESSPAAERRAKARRRAQFLAARDRAYSRAGFFPPKIEVRNGVRIERRGTVPAGFRAAGYIRLT